MFKDSRDLHCGHKGGSEAIKQQQQQQYKKQNKTMHTKKQNKTKMFRY